MNDDARNRHGVVPSSPQDDDPLDAWDAARERSPLERAEDGTWIVHGHPETLHVLRDPATFSSVVSTHPAIPAGMDPPEHGPWRALVDGYFTPERVASVEPTCRSVAAELIGAVTGRPRAEAMRELGEPFAVRVQCAFMGWPAELEDALTAWQDANRRATRAGDRERTAAVAAEFERRVVEVLAARRADGAAGDDVTGRLLRETIDGRPLTDDEIVAIVRTWTVGELGSIAAAVGIVVHALSVDPALQRRLRAQPAAIPVAVDEILRARGPLVANRRVATRDVELAGCPVRAGDRLRILWPSADRDARVFPEPGRVRLDRPPEDNLLYGAGIHVCPGAPLARMELRVATEELLARTETIGPVEGEPPRYAEPPQGGFASVPFRAA